MIYAVRSSTRYRRFLVNFTQQDQRNLVDWEAVASEDDEDYTSYGQLDRRCDFCDCVCTWSSSFWKEEGATFYGNCCSPECTTSLYEYQAAAGFEEAERGNPMAQLEFILTNCQLDAHAAHASEDDTSAGESSEEEPCDSEDDYSDICYGHSAYKRARYLTGPTPDEGSPADSEESDTM